MLCDVEEKVEEMGNSVLIIPSDELGSMLKPVFGMVYVPPALKPYADGLMQYTPTAPAISSSRTRLFS